MPHSPVSSLSVLALAPLALIAAACASAPPAMSLEEAKQVTASFAGAAFVPPPRTINDITAILERTARDNPGAVAEARLLADRSPPAGATSTDLAEFYFQRGRAAGAIGRARQRIEDLTQAVRHAAGGAQDVELRNLRWLMSAEHSAGNHSRAVAYARDAVAKVPPDRWGWQWRFQCWLAMVLALHGELPEAERAMEECRAASEETGRRAVDRSEGAERTAWVAIARGTVANARGQLADTERLHRHAVEIIARDPVHSRGTWLEDRITSLAFNLVRQGRLLEAENEARRALLGALRKSGRSSTPTALALQALLTVLSAQERFQEAETVGRAAVEIYETMGADPSAVQFLRVRWALAVALGAQGRWSEGLEQYDAIQAALAGDSASQRFLHSHYGLLIQHGWATALLRTRQVDRAIEVLRDVLARRVRMSGETDRATAQVRGALATAYAARSERALALREFAAATAILTAPLPVGDDESEARASGNRQVTEILEAYMALLADVRGTPLEREVGDAAVEALRLAEAARGRAVQDALAASAARSAAGTPGLADLVRREQDAAMQLTALSTALANTQSLPADQQNPQSLSALRTQVETLRRARQTLAQRIEREFPAYAQLVNPGPVAVDRVRASLRAGEALIVTHVAPNRAFVWAIPHEGRPAFTAVPVTASALEADVMRLRRALDPGARTLGEIPEFDLGLAHRLFETFLAPVAEGWRHAGILLVVPHGPLAHLPFALLPAKATALGPESGVLFSNYRAVPWLIRTHAVTVLPSVSALVALRNQQAGQAERRPFVGFGDPYFSREQARQAAQQSALAQGAGLTPRGVLITLRDLKVAALDSARLAILPRLPDTREEIRALASALGADPARDVFLGERANEQAVKTLDLASYRVIAFATHGLVAGDLDGLTQPALALTAPEVAQVDGDGLLTMEEILALRLNADWVVLSACNTASGAGAGAEAISGLGRAFFYAGARALLVSNWPVETTSARALTTDLFLRQAANPGLTRAQALQQTMVQMIDDGGLVDPETGRLVFSYAHPLFWAPFTLVGDGG